MDESDIYDLLPLAETDEVEFSVLQNLDFSQYPETFGTPGLALQHDDSDQEGGGQNFETITNDAHYEIGSETAGSPVPEGTGIELDQNEPEQPETLVVSEPQRASSVLSQTNEAEVDTTQKEWNHDDEVVTHAFDSPDTGPELYEVEEDERIQHYIPELTASTDASELLSDDTKLVVEVPGLAPEERALYQEIASGVIETVLEEIKEADEISYTVMYTDGRLQQISFEDLIQTGDGMAALNAFTSYHDGGVLSRKRKHAADEEWSDLSDTPPADPMEWDEDDAQEEEDGEPTVRRPCLTSLRPRSDSSRPSMKSSADEGSFLESSPPPKRELRSLRRGPRRSMRNAGHSDSDELHSKSRVGLYSDDDDDDDDLPLITSDVLPVDGRKKKLSRRKKQSKLQKPGRARSSDSDIEFEAPRRSGRSRREVDMRDDADIDEELFRIDDKPAAAPKIISVREAFKPPTEAFSEVHMPKCITCGGSKNRGQLIHCQGCTYSYHRHCIGSRAGREHMATKVGDENFVLQCRLCIELQRKKDPSAPRHSICQGCSKRGLGCKAFSEKKTARQEEKLREENAGVDPITAVDQALLNQPDNVLFRCVSCQRGWHLDHLPSARGQIQTVGTDLKAERMKDYALDWKCNDCNSTKHKPHRLVAWRPIKKEVQEQLPAFDELPQDDKEYLVKWDTRSYRLCTWMPGAWMYGYCAPAMRKAFEKKAEEQGLLKLSKEEAFPEEYLMPDVIFSLKMSDMVERRSKTLDLANISMVSRILVKFQGLGYDDVVWDTPPSQAQGEVYTAFVGAYHNYIQGKYFRAEPQSQIRARVREYHDEKFEEVDTQPAGLIRGRLMNYQMEGLNWLLGNFHLDRSVVLADEMGLGKTVQVVSLVTVLVQQRPKCWPFLIVVPNATCPNWRREFQQWSPDLRVVTYHGGKQSQELSYQYELFPDRCKDMRAHVVIMSYDSAQDPQTRVLFKSVQWQGLVVDEGQRLKNDQNLLYGALRNMKIPFRLLLTGTPLQNNKRELFNLLQFIDPTQDASKLDEEFAVLDKETLPKLHDRIRPYFLRRTKAGVLKFLPPMAQIILPVTMTSLQSTLSRSIMAKNPQLIQSIFHNSTLKKKERGSLNNILMQLRKVLCHPFNYSEAIEERQHESQVIFRNLVEASAKLLLLKLMLPKLKERGHRVLIFSQFLQQLDIMEDFLNGLGFGYRRLDGSMSSLEKQRRIDAYNAPDSELFAFLLSTRAGGVGINLATADTVIIMDPDFNPHQDIQALSRAHRIGQKKKVLCFQLVTKDSVEEKIMQMGRKKMALDHALIESMDDDGLGGDDLESILRHGAQTLFEGDEESQKRSIRYDEASVDKLLDRTQVEQTETSAEGSGDTQFAYARVWANDKDDFEDTLGNAEDEAPEPLNPNVWDAILAEREAEAKREAELEDKLLGRGNRRRKAINYKTNQSELAGLPDLAMESSDSSDDFDAQDAQEESDGDEAKLKSKEAAEGSENASAINTRKAQQTFESQSRAFPAIRRSAVEAAQRANQRNNGHLTAEFKRPPGRPPREPPISTTMYRVNGSLGMHVGQSNLPVRQGSGVISGRQGDQRLNGGPPHSPPTSHGSSLVFQAQGTFHQLTEAQLRYAVDNLRTSNHPDSQKLRIMLLQHLKDRAAKR